MNTDILALYKWSKMSIFSEIKHVLSGCLALPGLCLVCDVHEQDVKEHPVGRVCSVRWPRNCIPALCGCCGSADFIDL